MNREQAGGYEREPEETFLPLPPQRYSDFFHLATAEDSEETGFYRDILVRCACNRVLEIGCGTGRLTERLRASGIRITGIDLAPEMLAHSRHKRQAPVAVMDMRLLGFSRSFQAVIIPCNTLNLLGAPRSIAVCLNEIRSVLEDPGLLLLQLFVPDQHLADRSGQRLFQFSIFDIEDGTKLIRETIRCYNPNDRLLRLEERYKIRALAPGGKRENYQHALRLAALPAPAWLELLEQAGFHVISTASTYAHAPFREKSDSTLLVIARLA